MGAQSHRTMEQSRALCSFSYHIARCLDQISVGLCNRDASGAEYCRPVIHSEYPFLRRQVFGASMEFYRVHQVRRALLNRAKSLQFPRLHISLHNYS